MTSALKERSWSVVMQSGSNPQRKKGVTPKLARNWKGPYVVTRINDVVYRIQLGPRTKPRVVHCNRLWRYGGQSPPTWFTEKQTTVPLDTHDNAGGETNCTTTMSTNGAGRREPSHLIEGKMKAILTSSIVLVQNGELPVEESHPNVTVRTLSKRKKGEWCCE